MIVAFDELAKPPANEVRHAELPPASTTNSQAVVIVQTMAVFKKQILHLFSLLGACAVLNLHGAVPPAWVLVWQLEPSNPTILPAAAASQTVFIHRT